MESSSLPTLAVVALLSCRLHACSRTARASLGVGSDNTSASVECQQKNVNVILNKASISFVVAFVVSTTLPSSRPLLNDIRVSPENNVNSEHAAEEPLQAVESVNAKAPIFQTSDVVDLSVQFRGDDNSFVLSNSVAVAPDRSASRNPLPPVLSTRRQRRAHDTTSCNYSDFCNTDISRLIEAMVHQAETAHANRRAKKSKSNVAHRSPSKHAVTRKLSQEVSLEPDQVTKNKLTDGAIATRVNSRYIKGPIHKPNENPSHLLGPMFQDNMDDDVPAMTSCDSMSLASDHSFSTRCSFDTVSISPMKSRKSLSSLRNAEWPIIE